MGSLTSMVIGYFDPVQEVMPPIEVVQTTACEFEFVLLLSLLLAAFFSEVPSFLLAVDFISDSG